MKRILLSILAVCAIIFTTQAQSDNCGMATGVMVGAGTTVGATVDEGPASCGGATDVNVWYTFVAGSTILNATIDNGHLMSIWSGSCGALTEVDCVASGTAINLDDNNTPLVCGQAYYLMISVPSGSESAFMLTFNNSPACPVNDDCPNAMGLVNMTPTPGSTISSTSDLPTTTCDATATHNVWYTYTTVGRNITIDVSDPNQVITLYSGACGGLTELACGTTQVEYLNLLDCMTTYYISVSSPSAFTANFSITVTNPTEPCPVNDLCAMATPLSNGVTVPGSTVSSFDEGLYSSMCTGAEVNNVWYTYTTIGSDLTIDLTVANQEITLFEGICGGFVELDCVAGAQLVNNNQLDCNTTYYIMISADNASTSNFDITITNTTIPCPVNDDCVNAIPLVHADPCVNVSGTTMGGTVDNVGPGGPCLNDLDIFVWYSFVAQSSDVSIELENISPAAAIPNIVIFANDCAVFTEVIPCAGGLLLEVDNSAIMVGTTYLIGISMQGEQEAGFDLCFLNYPIPPNDAPCMATNVVVDGPLVSGTFNGSLPEMGVPIPECPNTENTIFYEFTVPIAPPVFEVNIELIPGYANNGEFEFTIYDDCAALVMQETFCTADPISVPAEFCVIPGETYTLLAGSELNDQGDFDISIGSLPTTVCTDNNLCDFAQDLGVIVSNCEPTPFLGECNTDACPDYFQMGGCDLTTGPTVWYEFMTDGNMNLFTLDIEIMGAPPGVFITFVDNVDCANPAGLCSVDNGDGDGDAATMLDIDVTANANPQTYYFAVTTPGNNGGTYDIQITAEPIPSNDDPCPSAANPPEVLTSGGTFNSSNCCAVGANDDPTADFANIECGTASDDDAVWFTFTPSGTNDGIEIVLNAVGANGIGGGTIEVYTGDAMAGCSGALTSAGIFECATFPVTLESPECLMPGDIFWIKLTTTEMNCGDYSITVTDIDVCVYADECVDITEIILDPTGLTPADQFIPTCVPGCLDLACPEGAPANGFCNFGNIPVVWIQVDTDANAAQLLIEVVPNGTWDPVYALFEQGVDCNDLNPVPLQGALSPCSSLIGGNAFDQAGVQENSTYWLAIGGNNVDFSDPAFDPNFQICVTSLESLVTCLPNDATVFELDGTFIGGFGWDPADPANLLCPGEDYELCLSFLYDASQTGADWLIGIIPSYGPGWETPDPASVTITTSPGANTTYDWYEPGTATEPILQENVPNICTFTNPNTGLLEICNVLTQGSCPLCPNGVGMGPGENLPGGWFWVSPGSGAGCANTGAPGEGWGIGWTTGTVDLCITLTVKEFIDQADCMANNDLSFSFMPFSDGIAGCWEDQTGECGLDYKQNIVMQAQCNVPPNIVHLNPGVGDAVCSGGQIDVHVATSDGTPFDIAWTAIDNPSVTGETIVPFSDPPTNVFPNGDGTIMDVLTNTSTTCQTVIYELYAYDPSNACPGPIDEIEVIVYPELMTMGGPFEECENGGDIVVETSIPMGDCGSVNYFYNWEDANGTPVASTNPWILSQPQVPGVQIFDVTVTDDNGCEAMTSVMVTIHPEMEFDFVQDNFSVCQDGITDGIIVEIDMNSLGGTPPYNFNSFTCTSSPPGIVINPVFPPQTGVYEIDEESGSPFLAPYTLTCELTDMFGCVGYADITLNLSQPPTAILTLVGNIPCDDGTAITWDLQATGTAISGLIPTLDLFNSSGSLINTINATSHVFVVSQADTYTLVVTDGAGCSSTAEVTVTANTAPAPVISGENVCDGQNATLEITNAGDYVGGLGAINWDTGDMVPIITVNPTTTTTYVVSVTDPNGCTAIGSYEVQVLPEPTIQIAGSLDFCTGFTTTLTASGGDSYEWNFNGAVVDSDDEITIGSPGGMYTLTVTSQGCSKDSIITVNESMSLSPSISGSDICDGSTATLDGGAGFDTYVWTTSGGVMIGNDTDQTIDVTTGDTYTLEVTDSNGCSGTGTYVVNAYTSPSSTVTPTVDVCNDSSSGASTTLDFTTLVSGSAGIWSDCDLTGIDISDPTNVDFDGLAANCINFCFTTNEASAPCVDSMYMMEVCIVDCQCPNPNTGTPGNLCSEGSLPFDLTTLELLSTDDGSWSYLMGSGPQNVTLTNETFDPTGVMAGVYTFVFTLDNPAGGGCDPDSEQMIEVFAPPAFTVDPDATACNDGSSGGPTSLNLNDYVTGASGTWSTASGIDISNITDVEFAGNPVGDTFVFTYTSDSAMDPCLNTSQNLVVTISNCQCPLFDLSTATLCDDGSPLDLTTLEGTTDPGSWSFSAGPQMVNVNGGMFDPAGLMPGDYELSYTLDTTPPAGCDISEETLITVNAAPTAMITPAAMVCSTTDGTPTSLNFDDFVTGGDMSGTWVNTDMVGVNFTDVTNVSFLGIADGTYTFTYTTASAVLPCNDQSYEIAITVDLCDCPSVLLGTPGTVCSDAGMVVLDDWKITTESGSWTDQNGSPINNGVFDATGLPDGTYTVTFTLDNQVMGCPGDNTMDIEVQSPPSTGTPGSLRICEGDAEVINLTTLLGTFDLGGVWFEEAGSSSTLGSFDAGNGLFDPVLQVPGVYMFTYSFTNILPCDDVETTVTVTIDPNPTADAGDDKTIDCDNPNVELNAGSSTGAPPLNYMWTEASGKIITNPTSSTITVTEAGNYSVEIIDNNDCVDTDNAVVDVDGNLPTMDLEVTSPVCVGDTPGSIIVINIFGGALPYEFSIDGGPWTGNMTYNDLPAGSYTLRLRDNNGCIFTAMGEILAAANPIVDLPDAGVIIELGETYTLSLLDNLNIDPADIANMVWTENDVEIYNDIYVESLVVNPLLPLNTYCVSITDINGCITNDCLTVTTRYEQDIYVPNVFNPTSQTGNDKFLPLSPDLESITRFYVFDRWGEQIYGVENIDLSSGVSYGWDGRFKGEEVVTGVYVFFIEFVYKDGSEGKIAGDVTLLR